MKWHLSSQSVPYNLFEAAQFCRKFFTEKDILNMVINIESWLNLNFFWLLVEKGGKSAAR